VEKKKENKSASRVLLALSPPSLPPSLLPSRRFTCGLVLLLSLSLFFLVDGGGGSVVVAVVVLLNVKSQRQTHKGTTNTRIYTPTHTKAQVHRHTDRWRNA